MNVNPSVGDALAFMTRRPTDNELALLSQYHQAERERLHDAPGEAAKLVDGGDPELAARALLASVILNLDEFVTLR